MRAARKGESHETPPTPLKPAQVLPSTGTVVAATPARDNTARRRLTAPILAVATLIVVIATAMLWPDSPWNPRAGANSVSLLPLRVIGSSQLQQAADALTEEMTTALAASPDITVRSATRVESLLRDGADIDQVGRRLGVAFIADGSVQGNPSQFRLTVRLLRADDAVAVWANTYNFLPEDLSMVARSVAESLAAAVLRARK